MLHLQSVSYVHPDRTLLFHDLELAIADHEKIALVGNNGSGKSTLLKIIAKEVQPSAGRVVLPSDAYLVPQLLGQLNACTVAEALRIDTKWNALTALLNGHTTEENFRLLNDDWTIEQRSYEALRHWGLEGIDLAQPMLSLSGGQQTKVLLAGIDIHQPQWVLLDEPSNHLDGEGRALLYDFIRHTNSGLIVASHDRILLSLLPTICELGSKGIAIYGGDYAFYVDQKKTESEALAQTIHSQEKALRKAKEKARETLERQQKLDTRGKGKQEQAGVARIMMNTLRNNAEKSTSKIKTAHEEKVNHLREQLQTLRGSTGGADSMLVNLGHPDVHAGKILFRANDIQFAYNGRPVWRTALDLQINSGERITLKGANGTGKTTLIKTILGQLAPQSGTVYRADCTCIYIDQDYSLLDSRLSVYEQVQRFNTSALQEHEIKIRLTRFLFDKQDWDKPCGALSGGERMRLLLCCLTTAGQAIDLIVLDEPTNNLDLHNVQILAGALQAYRGTLVVVSHDEVFLEEVGVMRTIELG